MKIKIFLRMIFYSLLRRRVRMLIALIAVAVGATIISGMVTVYREVPQQLGREFRAYGANFLIIPSEGENFSEEKISREVEGVQPQLVNQIANSEFNVLSKLQILILLVTLIILILTLICVTTTMLAVVTERRKEIGLKKALGAANENIIREFLGEGCLLGFFGGIFGSFFGYLFAESVSVQVFGRGIYFSVSIAIFSIILSIFVSGVASLIPVKIATKVDPAIVLRGE